MSVEGFLASAFLHHPPPLPILSDRWRMHKSFCKRELWDTTSDPPYPPLPPLLHFLSIGFLPPTTSRPSFFQELIGWGGLEETVYKPLIVNELCILHLLRRVGGKSIFCLISVWLSMSYVTPHLSECVFEGGCVASSIRERMRETGLYLYILTYDYIRTYTHILGNDYI
jgi:hypothetical protein